MKRVLKIGTRDSQLAVWQATLVKNELAKHAIETELVFIKSEGDIDLTTPLYAIGVQGVFTRTLDIALLNKRIDIAVHSMKDVPTQLAHGIIQAAILKRASYKDILVYKGEWSAVSGDLGIVNGEWITVNAQPATHNTQLTIATSSVRRKAQWLHRYPNHTIENLRGNVNTRLQKINQHNWNGAIFAAAGLERIHLRPENSIELDWMLPAPAQGAIMVVCRGEDKQIKDVCNLLHDASTAFCVKQERDFLKTLMGGCSTPISALAEINNEELYFRGNILSLDGKEIVDVEIHVSPENDVGVKAANIILQKGGDKIVNAIRHGTK